MSRTLFRNVALLSLAAVCCTAVAAYCCGGVFIVKLPENLKPGSGLVAGDHFYGLTETGKLLKVGLGTGKVTDLGTPAEKLSGHIDVLGDRGLVAGPGKAYLIDLKSGKSLRAMPIRAEGLVGLGLIDTRRAFTHTRAEVVVLDLESGKALHTIALRPGTERGLGAVNRGYSPSQRVGNRLFVACDSADGLAIIDLEKGKLLDKIKVPAWRVGSISVVGDVATVVGLRYGYGVWTNSIAEIDLKTKKVTTKKLVHSTLRASQIVRGPGNVLLLTDGEQAHRYADDGTLTPLLAKEECGKVIATWEDNMVTVGNPRVLGGKVLQILPLPRSSPTVRK